MKMRRALDESYRLIEQIQHSRTAVDVCEGLLAYAGRFGATNVLAGTIPPSQALRQEQISHLILDAWPTEWSHRYFSNGYVHHDPTVRLVSRGSVPFLWSELGGFHAPSKMGRRVMDEAADFGLREGLTLAFSTPDAQVVGFSIAGDQMVLGPLDRLSLQLFAAYAFCCAISLSARQSDRLPIALSARQKEVLRWASEGLTVSEIGDRMKVSCHTADMHLRLARDRLGVASSLHAVAEAIRRGLIT